MIFYKKSVVLMGWMVLADMASAESIYFRTQDKVTWGVGSNICNKLGAELALIENPTENKYIFETFAKNQPGGVWIDGNDRAFEGVWLNSNNGRMHYENFETPDLEAKHENCATMFPKGYGPDGTWNDAPCGHKTPAVCEINVSGFGSVLTDSERSKIRHFQINGIDIVHVDDFNKHAESTAVQLKEFEEVGQVAIRAIRDGKKFIAVNDKGFYTFYTYGSALMTDAIVTGDHSFTSNMKDPGRCFAAVMGKAMDKGMTFGLAGLGTTVVLGPKVGIALGAAGAIGGAVSGTLEGIGTVEACESGRIKLDKCKQKVEGANDGLEE